MKKTRFTTLKSHNTPLRCAPTPPRCSPTRLESSGHGCEVVRAPGRGQGAPNAHSGSRIGNFSRYSPQNEALKSQYTSPVRSHASPVLPHSFGVFGPRLRGGARPREGSRSAKRPFWVQDRKFCTFRNRGVGRFHHVTMQHISVIENEGPELRSNF